METLFSADRESFKALREQVQQGDCVRIPGFASIAANAKELLHLAQALFDAGADLISDHEELDTRTEYGSAFRDFCRYLTELGCPEITKIFCENDERIYGNLPGLKFERKGTLGKGAEKCDFCIRKI